VFRSCIYLNPSNGKCLSSKLRYHSNDMTMSSLPTMEGPSKEELPTNVVCTTATATPGAINWTEPPHSRRLVDVPFDVGPTAVISKSK